MRITKLLQIFIFSVMIFSAGRISAQIQITSQDILGLIGNTIEAEIDTTESIVVSVGSPGTNQVWDFSNVKVNEEPYTYEFIVPAGTPFAGEFPTPTLLRKLRLQTVD